MENQISWSSEFETWVVRVNLSTFAFKSKQSAESFLDAFENGREEFFSDDDDELEPGIGHNETHSKNCRCDRRKCPK